MNKPSILIVDDEQSIVTTLHKALEVFEYEIDEAMNGTTACEKISAKAYDCILLDLRLPDMDGMEILRHCKPQNVIMITAHGTVDNAVEAMKLGCVDYIQKPFDLERIRATVQQVLDRKNLSYEHGMMYESLIQLAKLDIQNRHYRKAIETVNKALEVKPESAEAYNTLGVLYEILDDLPKALSSYQTALKLDPNIASAKDNLARLRGLEVNKGLFLGI